MNADFDWNMAKIEQIDMARLPKHIAIIMDGNGRWAQKKGLQRILGHRSGVQAVRTVTEAAAELGIQYVTLYAFSTENWNRPQEEVDALMALLVDTLEKETPSLKKNNVRLRAIGDMQRLPEATREKFCRCIAETAQNDGLNLVLAISYSARWEITEAFKKAIQLAQEGLIKADKINESTVERLLSTAGMPDPDLLIRTSGEMRISNFLLWQLAYSELYFTSVNWPDFGKKDFYEAIYQYQHRERRYGKTSAQINDNK